jgi:hypothetical protein
MQAFKVKYSKEYKPNVQQKLPFLKPNNQNRKEKKSFFELEV